MRKAAEMLTELEELSMEFEKLSQEWEEDSLLVKASLARKDVLLGQVIVNVPEYEMPSCFRAMR